MENITNYEMLIKAGCKQDGNILIPTNKKVTPIDVRRINSWSIDRIKSYIKDMTDAK